MRGIDDTTITALQLFAQLNNHVRMYGSNQLQSTYANGPADARDARGMDFNITLINYFDPNIRDIPLRDEPYFGMGKLAVGWHRGIPP
jgi:hypothetical protein